MPRLVAAWSDFGVVGVWDIDQHLKRLDEPGAAGKGLGFRGLICGVSPAAPR